uniref:Uncharacterized protein n=1 Tax=Strongyloides stercoralis TaxID=6248 RepID=A0AAF5DG74_STRER
MIKFFFGRNSFSNNADYDKEFIIESRAWKLLWKKLEAVVEEIGGCCSTGDEFKTCKLFFLWKKFRINASYDKESRAWKLLWKELEAVALLELNRKRVNFFLGGIHLELMLVTIVKLDIIVIVLMAVIQLELSGAFSLLRRKLGDVSLLQLNLKHGSSFVKDSFNDNANFDKEH